MGTSMCTGTVTSRGMSIPNGPATLIVVSNDSLIGRVVLIGHLDVAVDHDVRLELDVLVDRNVELDR